VEFHPATPDRWDDLERLFGPRGACAGCWCMFWRLRNREWELMRGEDNRAALRQLVDAGAMPGILAYVDGQAAGWCAIAPRSDYLRLSTSRILKPVDERPVWSAPCFFVARPFRRQGLTVALLRAAVEHARSQGAQIVEGYPVEPAAGKVPDTFVYTGLASAFRQAGFVEVARRSPTRPVMRLSMGND
jgi:GNAT superfamily N-acetyltransferase